MEFKGTKGNWRKGYNYDGDIVADQNDGQPSKCVCLIVDIRKQRSLYDALLITKSPELLVNLNINNEMMKSVLELFGDKMSITTKFGLTAQIEANDKLIKEATEI